MRWMVALVPLLLLAGCSETPVPDEGPTGMTDQEPRHDAPDGAFEATGPSWQVGDHFGHHIYFGNADTEGEHINAIVVEDLGDAWRLATDSEFFAKMEATYQVPVLGDLAKSDLSTTAFGGAWDVYDFPITHGKTWSGTIDMPQFGLSYDIEFEAAYTESLSYAGGEGPGFTINGTVEGQRLVTTDWVPELGWYTQFVFYDLSTEDPDDHQWRVRSMGTGHDWTGTYYVAEAELEADLAQEVYQEGTGVVAETDPYASFEVGEDDSHLVGYAYAFAFAGAAKTELVAPDGTRHGPSEVVDDGGFSFVFAQYDLDAQPGEWRAMIANGGVASGGGLRIWSVELSSFEM